MKVHVNNKEVTTTASTIFQLAEELQLPITGVAIAVNNKMISRTGWSEFTLHENDDLIIIQAACGG